MGNTFKKKSGLSFSSKLICVILPIILFLASNLGMLFYFLINVSPTMHTLHATSLLKDDLMKIHHILHDFSEGKGDSKELERLQERVRKYLYALRDGNKALGIMASPGKLDESGYQNLWRNWDRHIHHYEDVCQPMILQVLRAPTVTGRTEALSRYNKESEAFFTDISRTSIMTQEHFLIKRFITFLDIGIGIFIASILGIGATFFLIRLFVRQPLEDVVEGMEQIAKGKWGKTLEVKTRDELGRLVQSFNHLSLELEKNVNALEREKLGLQEANKKLQESCYKDLLTGLYNYYYFQETLKTECLRASRHAVLLSLIMLDVDGFKHINDTFGHDFGNFVLEEMSKRIKESLRSTDTAYRYGGEEFAILLPHTDYEGAQKVAQKVKDNLCGQAYQNDAGLCNVSVTMGISSLEEPEAREAMDLVRLADEALREGKSKGGNSILLASHTHRWREIDITVLEDYKRRLATTEKNLKKAYMDSTTALLRALESKDVYTAVHSCLVATYVWHFSGTLKLTPEEREVIKNAALLHDLGKISIPGAILRKDSGLSSEEISLIRQHPHHGASLIKGIRFLEQEAPIILYHHERWDGQGYPGKLKEKDIPLGARILALPDAYEAITSPRPYQKARPPNVAFKLLREESGRQFDPELVEPFIKAMQDFLSVTRRVYISQLDKTIEMWSP